LPEQKIGTRSQAKTRVQRVLSLRIAELLKQRTLLGSVVHIDHELFIFGDDGTYKQSKLTITIELKNEHKQKEDASI
jgi:hypothetical protein